MEPGKRLKEKIREMAKVSEKLTEGVRKATQPPQGKKKGGQKRGSGP